MYDVGDVIKIHGVNHVVIEVVNGYAETSMPLRDWLCMVLVIEINGEKMTIDEYLSSMESQYLAAHQKCNHLTANGDCELHSDGAEYREPCIEGPCPDEKWSDENQTN